MAKEELFAVRTSHIECLGPDDYVVRHRATLARGRQEAIRHAERIGRIDRVDRPRVREFLEGRGMPAGVLNLTSGEVVWTGAAVIYRVDEEG